MKIAIKDLKELINTDWSDERLASNLSQIGHETEIVDGDHLQVSLTTNRKDCQDIKYLAFDLIGIFPEISNGKKIIEYGPGKRIDVTLERVNKLLGSQIDYQQYKKIEQLGFKVEADHVVAPDFRIDVNEAADIAEEVFRLLGSDIIHLSPLDNQPIKKSDHYHLSNSARVALQNIGFSETKTISFSDRGHVEIKNPFNANLPYMRESLLGGLLETLSRNPFMRKAMFYEIGHIFKPEESTYLGIVFSGYKSTEEIEDKLNETLGAKLSYIRVDQELLDKYSVKQPNVVFAEVPIDDISVAESRIDSELSKYKKMSQFPPLVRDITTEGREDLINELPTEFSSVLFIEKIDSYNNPDTGKTKDTYRIIFQKFDGSFTGEEIAEIDSKLEAFLEG